MLALAAQYGMEDFYAEKYLNTLRVGLKRKLTSCSTKATASILQ